MTRGEARRLPAGEKYSIQFKKWEQMSWFAGAVRDTGWGRGDCGRREEGALHFVGWA